MILLVHIIIATLGIVFASSLLIKPVAICLLASKIFGAFTLFSGIVLIAYTEANIVKTCFTGLIYFSFIIIATRRATTALKFNNTRH